MDMPPIQYARAGDGTRIAWTRLPGESPPWLHVYTVGAPPMAMTLSMPSRRGFIEGLSGPQATVLFDWRGSGLSGPISGPLTLEDLADDIAVVCDAAGEPLDAMVMNTGIFPAALHATWCARWRRLLLVTPSPTVQRSFGFRLFQLLEEDSEGSYWLLWKQILRGYMDVSLDSTERLVREAVNQVPLASWLAYQEVLQGADLAAALPALECPVFIALPEHPAVREPALEVAGFLPDARLLIVDNAYHTPAAGHELRRLLDGSAVRRSAEFGPAALQAPDGLTPRELEVLRLLAAGRSNKEIAGDLVISLHTVESHVGNIYARTGVSNRAEAASYATRNGLA